MMENNSKKYMNPYLAGFLLGLILLAAFYLSGRGLGASGAVKNIVVTTVDAIAPEHAENSVYYSKYINNEQSPMKSWLVFLVSGVLIGGFISGVISNRMKFKIEHGPHISSKTRIIMAIIGGALFGAGAQFARGCTSGSALSGMAILLTAGFISMMAIFGTGFMIAYFFRKLWI